MLKVFGNKEKAKSFAKELRKKADVVNVRLGVENTKTRKYIDGQRPKNLPEMCYYVSWSLEVEDN